MRTEMKLIRRADEIVLIASNRGATFLWLLVLEIAVLTAYFFVLATNVGISTELLVPAAPSLALVAWTWAQLKPDLRMVMHVATGQGRLMRIWPVIGPREIARFGRADVGVVLRQIRDWEAGARRNEYVAAIELAGGARHVLSGRGPLLAYNRTLTEFSRAAGIGNRVVRLPAI